MGELRRNALESNASRSGQFEVFGLVGNLICREFPLRLIRDVTGHVDYAAGTEFGVEGAGTMHRDDMREMTPAKPFRMEVSKIGEGLRIRCGRAQLGLADIAGRLDVSNDFGDTTLSIQGPMEGSHRLVSQSGRISVEMDKRAFDSTVVNAFSNHGGVRTNLSRELLSDHHFVSNNRTSDLRQNWDGFRKVTPDAECGEKLIEVIENTLIENTLFQNCLDTAQ